MKIKCITRFSELLILIFLFVCCKKEIDFTKMSNEEKLEFYRETAEAVFEKGDVLFQECHSSDEFGEHLDDIRSIKGVTDAYVDGDAVYVQLAGDLTLSYLYTKDSFRIIDDNVFGYSTPSSIPTKSSVFPNSMSVGQINKFKTACIANQPARDESRAYVANRNVPYSERSLSNIGINVEYIPSPDRDFFLHSMFDYDLVFLITHGSYDSTKDRHWLITGEEINQWDDFWYYTLDDTYVGDELGLTPSDITTLFEVHDGDSVAVKYYMVSDKDIASSSSSFKKKGEAIIFNVACESLRGSDNLWEAYRKRGAGFYLGYDRINSIGHEAGMFYLGRLSSGMNLYNAYVSLPSYCRTNHRTKENNKGEIIDEWDARLRVRYDVDSDFYKSFITSSSVTGYEDQSGKEGIAVKMVGVAPMFAPSALGNGFNYDSFRYGFCISETPVISDSKMLDPLRIGDEGCSYQDYQVSFSAKAENLESEKKYYYWSFVFDGHDYVFSEMSSFETKRINRVIPEDILDQMDDYIPIHDGVNPPNIEGQYLVSPMVLVHSTHGYEPGDLFADTYVQFYNQDMKNNTLDYQDEEVSYSYNIGKGAFISGEGNDFSVFFNTTGTSYHEKYNVDFKMALVISGTKSSNGIKDLTYAFVMVDKSDDSEGYTVPIGTFRVFKDQDGLSVPTNHFKSPSSAPMKRSSYNPSVLPSMIEAVQVKR